MPEGHARVDLETSVSTPSAARMYDYFLGGKDNYEVDEEAAERALAAVPEGRVLARANRGFLQRAVRFLAAEAGIRQFIDIGSGLPTQGNVHEIAQAANPHARVVYVDYDPVVLAHNQELLSGTSNTVTIQADMRQPDGILTHPRLGELIDFDQPVAVLFVAVLHFATDEDDPWGIMTRFREALVSGSYVVLSHGSPADPETAEQAAKGWEQSPSSFTPRTSEQIRAFFAGFDLLEPGLVGVAEWRPDPGEQIDGRDTASFLGLAGVGRKP